MTPRFVLLMIAVSSSTSRFVLHVASSYARRSPLMAPTPPAPPVARGRGGATTASLSTVVLTVPPPLDLLYIHR
jgi:hypothetical protein